MSTKRIAGIVLLTLLVVAVLGGGAFASYRVGYTRGYVAGAEAVGEEGAAALPHGYGRT